MFKDEKELSTWNSGNGGCRQIGFSSIKVMEGANRVCGQKWGNEDEMMGIWRTAMENTYLLKTKGSIEKFLKKGIDMIISKFPFVDSNNRDWIYGEKLWDNLRKRD